mgnify:FL=1
MHRCRVDHQVEVLRPQIVEGFGVPRQQTFAGHDPADLLLGHGRHVQRERGRKLDVDMVIVEAPSKATQINFQRRRRADSVGQIGNA